MNIPAQPELSLREALTTCVSAMQELHDRGVVVKAALDKDIPAGEPVHPQSGALTWPLSTIGLALDKARAALARPPQQGAEEPVGRMESGGPAFPHPDYLHAGPEGMTLRDYLAAKAMQALLAARCYPMDKSMPVEAYAIADEMLKAGGVMSIHTPGPWAVNPFNARVDSFGETGSVPICEMLWPTSLRTEDETEANGRLIAAAPELLSALQGLIACKPGGDHETFLDALADATRAIAKATGAAS